MNRGYTSFIYSKPHPHPKSMQISPSLGLPFFQVAITAFQVLQPTLRGHYLVLYSNSTLIALASFIGCIMAKISRIWQSISASTVTPVLLIWLLGANTECCKEAGFLFLAYSLRGYKVYPCREGLVELTVTGACGWNASPLGQPRNRALRPHAGLSYNPKPPPPTETHFLSVGLAS